MHLIAVTPRDADALWPIVGPMLERAYERVGDNIPPDTLVDIEARRLTLWIADDGSDIRAALLTRIVPSPAGLICKMVACSGEGVGDWAHFRSRIEEYALAEGCVKTALDGRPGWAKFFPDYRLTIVTLEKDLAHAGR